MGSFAKIFYMTYDSAEVNKTLALKTNYMSLRLIKNSDYINPGVDSTVTNILLNGKCVDPETRNLYLFYIDRYFNSAWIIEVNIDTRTQTVVYFDRTNRIGFDPNYKIYNARVVYGKIIWTDNKNPVYQMDIARAKKSFFFSIGYDPHPITTEWNNIRSYIEDEIVSRGNDFYKCILPNSSQDPKITSGYWEYLCPIKDAYYSMNIENFYFAPIPPKLAPVVTYVLDPDRKINNLKQTLFQFAYNYIYMDYRESTYSPACVVPLPQSEEEFNTGLANENISLNNQIKITVNTGGEEVRKIKVIGRSSIDPSKWWVVDEIDKFEEAESLTMGGVDSVSNLVTAERNLLNIIVPLPIVRGISISNPEFNNLNVIGRDATAESFYIEGSVDNMYWYYNQYL